MRRHTLRAALLAALLLLPALASAADFPAAARDVAADLAQARAEQAETKAALTREAKDLAARQAQLQAALQAEKERLARAQEELEAAAQAKRDLQARLAQQKGESEELAGHVRTAARDFLALAERSPVTARQPQRLEELRALLDKKRFPGLDEIQGLMDGLLLQIAASGVLERFTAPIVGRGGAEAPAEVVRLGDLGAVYAQGERVGYLTLGPATGRLLAAGGDLPWLKERDLRAWLAGESPALPLDISGGAALRTLARRGGVLETLEEGGPLVWPILAVGLVALLLILERLVFLRRVRANTDGLMAQVNDLVGRGDLEGARAAAAARAGRPTANVLLAGLALEGAPSEAIDAGLGEAILRELPRLERFLTALKVLAAVAPLLGLLGTVTGMINTFQVITVFGTGDPRLMAGGISEALITTQLGLAVAIPVLIAASLLARAAQRAAGDMEEKAVALSAALISRGA